GSAPRPPVLWESNARCVVQTDADPAPFRRDRRAGYPSDKARPALAAPSATSSSCLFRRCAVVDDPNFAEVPQAHEHLVEIRVVVDSIEMCPVGICALRWRDIVINVYALRVRSHITVVRFLSIDVLNQVIPQVPFPNDLSAGVAH